jgi:hypothetical protein
MMMSFSIVSQYTKKSNRTQKLYQIDQSQKGQVEGEGKSETQSYSEPKIKPHPHLGNRENKMKKRSAVSRATWNLFAKLDQNEI